MLCLWDKPQQPLGATKVRYSKYFFGPMNSVHRVLYMRITTASLANGNFGCFLAPHTAASSRGFIQPWAAK